MITDNDFDREVENHLAKNAQEKPPREGYSRFIHEYMLTYDRMLPQIIMFEDVRDLVREDIQSRDFRHLDDFALAWISFHIFFERMLAPLCEEWLLLPAQSLHRPQDSEVLSRLGEELCLGAYLPFDKVTTSQEYFKPLSDRLNEVADENLVAMMEKLFVIRDRGLRLMHERLRMRFNRALSFTRFFLKLLMGIEPLRASGVPGRRLGVLFALAVISMDEDDGVHIPRLLHETLRKT